MPHLTRILQRSREGDPEATEELMSLVYAELRRIAAHKMAGESPGHTLQPTALVHEAWLRMAKNGVPEFENRAHFFASAAEAMRRVLIDNARRKSRLKRGARQQPVELRDAPVEAWTDNETLLEMDQALNRLEAEDPGKAHIVKLKFFVGMTNREVAESLGVTERTVERSWAYAKAWLFRSIRGKT